jgi:aspartate 1-decarboxylase
MELTLLKGKIHRATVTQCDLHYEGSISVDAALLERAGILDHEQVDVLNINNGQRFTTYAIPAPAGSGTIGINGAAARLASAGDLVIIIAYARMGEAEAKSWQPRVLLVDSNNRPLAPNLRVMET